MQTRRAVVLALLVGLAGCLGGPSGSGPADTPTETISTDVTETMTETTSPTTATTTTTTKAVTGAFHESPVFDYENLSAESRADFDSILDSGAVETADPLFAPASRTPTTI